MRGGFIPPTPFYKKYRTAATKKSWRTVPLTPAKRGTFSIPGITRRPVRVTPVTKRPTKTQPKLAPKVVVKKVQTQEDMARRKRRAFRYLPTLYKKRPNMMGRRRQSGSPMQKVKPTSEGATSSFYMRYRRLKRRLYGIDRMSAEQTRVSPSFNKHVADSGRQAVWSISSGALGALIDLINSMPTYPGNFPTENRQLYVKNITHKYMFSNCASTNVFVDLYEVEPREDTDTGKGPVSLFNAGIGNMVPGETAASLGVSPYQSQGFTKNYIIKKKYTLELAPGRTHVHTSKYNIGKLFGQQDVLAGPADIYRKGFTHTLMCVAYGEPVNTAEQPAPQTITSSLVSINTYSLDTIRFVYASPVTKDMLYTPLAENQINTQNLLNYDEGSGAVETVVAA